MVDRAPAAIVCPGAQTRCWLNSGVPPGYEARWRGYLASTTQQRAWRTCEDSPRRTVLSSRRPLWRADRRCAWAVQGAGRARTRGRGIHDQRRRAGRLGCSARGSRESGRRKSLVFSGADTAKTLLVPGYGQGATKTGGPIRCGSHALRFSLADVGRCADRAAGFHKYHRIIC